MLGFIEMMPHTTMLLILITGGKIVSFQHDLLTLINGILVLWYGLDLHLGLML